MRLHLSALLGLFCLSATAYGQACPPGYGFSFDCEYTQHCGTEDDSHESSEDCYNSQHCAKCWPNGVTPTGGSCQVFEFTAHNPEDIRLMKCPSGNVCWDLETLDCKTICDCITARDYCDWYSPPPFCGLATDPYSCFMHTINSFVYDGTACNLLSY